MMYKRIFSWISFTVVLGIFPLLFTVIVKYVTKSEISLSIISPELVFFNVMLNADGIKTLYNIKNSDINNKAKDSFFFIIVILLIFLAIIYGMLLLNSNIPNLDLQLEKINKLCVFFTIICVIVSLCIQVVGGLKDE